MAGYRPSYTVDEDMQILKSIIKFQLYYSVRGRSLWKDLSSVGYLDRTWMSLQNRFEKTILPNISNPKYTIPDIEKRKIELAWHQTSTVFKNSQKAIAKNKRDKNSSSSEEIDVESSSAEDDKNTSSDDEIIIDDTDKQEKNLDANNKQISRDVNNESLQSSDDSLVFALNSTITMIEEKVDKQTTHLDNTNVTKSNSNDFTTFMESETVEINSSPEHEATNEKSCDKKSNNLSKHNSSDNKMQAYETTDDESDIFVTCKSNL